MKPPTVSRDPLRDVVLQCSSCKTIVGDTHTFICVYKLHAAEYIALRAATEVTVDRIPKQTSAQDEDDPSTHFDVCCSGCGTVIGRMYTSSPPALAAVQDAFSFDIGKCMSYKLGTAELSVAGGEAAGPAAEMRTQANSSQTAGSEDLLLRFEALEAELLKMQGMILLHDSQLQGLPGYDAVRQLVPPDIATDPGH